MHDNTTPSTLPIAKKRFSPVTISSLASKVK
jgi:hypothetical protein